MKDKIKSVFLEIENEKELIVTGWYTPPCPDEDTTGPGIAATFNITKIDGMVLDAITACEMYKNQYPDKNFLTYLEEKAIEKILKLENNAKNNNL